jgi:hypothetical protein
VRLAEHVARRTPGPRRRAALRFPWLRGGHCEVNSHFVEGDDLVLTLIIVIVLVLLVLAFLGRGRLGSRW